MILTCDDIRAAGLSTLGRCCTSCHEDAEYYERDYPLVEEYPPNKDGRYGSDTRHSYVERCCGVRYGMPPLTRDEFARMIRMRRRDAR